MTRLLLADDDTELCELLQEYLSGEGFNVTLVHDGAAAVAELREQPYDLVILDVMMPKMNGFDALREMRNLTQTPVLMLTAKGDDVDRIVGLEMGADDYLAKPCNPRELVARIRAILRRAGAGAADAEAAVIRLADIELLPASRKALCQGVELGLTGTEFNLLRELLLHAGEVVSKKYLTEMVLDRKLTQYDRSIDMHVSNIRRKLGPYAGGEARIQSVRGAGYIFVVPLEATPESK